MLVYSKLKAGSCWHPLSSTRYWVMTVLFPLSHLSSYSFILTSSLAVCVIHLCMYLGVLIHAFIFTHSLFCPVTLYSVYVIYSLISYDTFITISAICYVFCAYDCVEWSTHVLFFLGIMFWTLHSGEPEIEDVCHWIQLWIRLNSEWEKNLHQGTINKGSTVVDILLLIPDMFYSPSIVWRIFF